MTTSQASNITKSLDEQFIVYMLEIDSRYKVMSKADRSKIELWVSVLTSLIDFEIE